MMTWTWFPAACVVCIFESKPFCMGWWLEKLIFPVAVAGVIAGFALWQIKKKRASDYASEQLSKFYAPLLGKLSELAAHRKLDETVKEVNAEAHSRGLQRDAGRLVDQAYVRETNATTEQVKKFFEETLPRRFTQERVGLYVAMRQHFTDNLAYADEDTRRGFYDSVYEEIEKMKVYRDSGEGDFLPQGREILGSKVDMSKIEAFHVHIQARVEQLKREIKG